MTRIVFNSSSLPDGLAEDKRRKLWRDLYADLYGTPDVHFLDDRPFQADFVFTAFGGVTVGQCKGTVNHVKRTARDAAADSQAMCYLAINRSNTRLHYETNSRDITLGDANLTLISSESILKAHFDPDISRYDLVALPRQRLGDSVAGLDDLLYRSVDSSQPAAQLLRSYIDILGATPNISEQPGLAPHIETTLLDLVTLVLNNRGDTAEMATARGLRSARLQTIFAEIQGGFSDPALARLLSRTSSASQHAICRTCSPSRA